MGLWYFCKEASEALRAIRDEYKDEIIEEDGKLVAKPHPKYWDAFKFVQKVCPHCLEYLPEIQDKILRAKKFNQGSCCGIEPCEILDMIENLRNVTKDKLLDDGWKSQVELLNNYICCIRKQIQEQWKRDVNTFPHITELPNISVKGLLDFKYPNYRIPPLWKPKIKSNEWSYKIKDKGFSVVDGNIEFNGHKKEPDDLMDIKMKPSYNVNGGSARFKLQWKTYIDYPESPFTFIYDILCDGNPIRFNGSINSSISIKLPNLSFDPHLTINIDPCLAKYLPPLAIPTNELKTLTLGGGEEFGIYENYKLISSNFKTGFDPNSNFIDDLVKTAKETFEEIPRKGKDKLTGLIENVSFPKTGKGREWSE